MELPGGELRRFGAGAPVRLVDPRPRLLPPDRDAGQARTRRVVHRRRVGLRRPRRVSSSSCSETPTRRPSATRALRRLLELRPAPAPPQRLRPLAPQHRLPLRPRQRAVRAHARRDDDLLLRHLRAARGARSRRRSGEVEQLCRLLELGPEDHVLEIGCGWGGFARHAAETHGCRVTGITISREQAVVARERTRGLPVEILEQDYRAGRRWSTPRSCRSRCRGDRSRPVRNLLRDDRPRARAGRPRGRADDPRPRAALGPLPPDARLDRALRLPRLPHPFARGAHPCRHETLAARHLRRRRDRRALRRDAAPLARELPRARSRTCARLGYDRRFERTWDFYLAFCEAAFRMRALRDVQLLLARPGAAGERVPTSSTAVGFRRARSGASTASRSSARSASRRAARRSLLRTTPRSGIRSSSASSTSREIHYMAKVELFRLRPVAALLRSLNAFPVERGRR